MEDAYAVRLAGLAGDFAIFNGTQIVQWQAGVGGVGVETGCLWRATLGADRVELYYATSPAYNTRWLAVLTVLADVSAPAWCTYAFATRAEQHRDGRLVKHMTTGRLRKAAADGHLVKMKHRCDPTGVYEFIISNCRSCVDPLSCVNSAAATCSVWHV